MKKLLAVVFLTVCAFAQGVAGHWQVSMDTPHGPMKGSMEFKQDGSKVAGTLELGPMGSFAFKGSVEGAKIAFDVELPENQGTLKFAGTIEGDKMSGTTDPHNFNWAATR